MELTLRWAQRCRDWAADHPRSETTGRPQLRFGIVQGATFADLRERGARELAAMDFDGYAIGGVSVGEPETEMMLAIERSEPFLPAHKPRYAMGLGHAAANGRDDRARRGYVRLRVAHPDRAARHGVYGHAGTLNLRGSAYIQDKDPIVPGCVCPACREFSRGYLRHLLKAEEILGLRLVGLHNLHFYLDLMQQTRDALEAGTFAAFRGQVCQRL